MAFTVNQNPRLQIGDAQLGSSTDQIALIWQTKGSSSGDSFVVEYRPANSNGVLAASGCSHYSRYPY